jgi:hypothetical protein
MSGKSNNKWKDALLKTSLPLEFLVAEKLAKLDFDVSGEFTFVRKNEQNVDTEFSVDLRASRMLYRRVGDYNDWAQINLLIECKYNYPGVKWVFAPHPQESSLLTTVVTTFQDLSKERISNEGIHALYFDRLHVFDVPLHLCIKGIELHESDANTQSITRGLNQLKWAIPQLVSDLLHSQLSVIEMGWAKIEFICPILVTTASLYVLRTDLHLSDFQNAENLNDVSEKVEALMVSQDQGSQMSKYIEKLTDDIHDSYPEVVELFRSVAKVQNVANEFQSFYWNSRIGGYMSSAASRVLVVTLDAFERLVAELGDSIEESKKTLKQVAIIKVNEKKGTAWFEPLPKMK